MTDSSAGTLLLELVDVVTDLTRRQRELLRSLQTFREDILHAETTVAPYTPPPPRFLMPPPPPPRVAPPAPTVVAPPAPPVAPPLEEHRPRDAVAPEAPTSAPSTATRATVGERRSHPLHRWRDYDYFAELDDLLARLPVQSQAQEQGPIPDQ
jgi:hypothetical protein